MEINIMTDSEFYEKFDEFWVSCKELNWDKTVEKILKYDNSEIKEELIYEGMNRIIDNIILMCWKYSEDVMYKISTMVSAFTQLSKAQNGPYFKSIEAFFNKEYSACKKHLKAFIDTTDDINEVFISENFQIFKNAFDGFWDYAKKLISSKNPPDGIIEMMSSIEAFYSSDNCVESEEICLNALQKNPDSFLLKAFLAEIYYNQKKWRLAASYFESLGECNPTLPLDLQAFMMAWCYDKNKDYQQAIESYKSCIKLNPNYPYAKNNLAYIYYKTKEYQKSLKLYKECVDSKLDLDFTCNGYAYTLISAGKIEEAEKFISISPAKIRSYVRKKLETVKNKGFIAEQQEENLIIAPGRQRYTPKDKSEQFSSEKLLEDELENRLINGSSIFGVPLKIYKRKGEYGRQLVIPVGRLDLLAEDDNGNLYIIELKKDSGYDDAFEQIQIYIDWFRKSKYCKKNTKIFGIICLNNPPKKLIDKVRDNKDIRLFEYSISYSEII